MIVVQYSLVVHLFLPLVASCISAYLSNGQIPRKNIRMIRMFVLTLLGCLTLTTLPIYGQCYPAQTPPNCDDCKEWHTKEIIVCHAGINYYATLELCTQFALPPNPIDNPCTPDCKRALDAITWVRRICVDQNLKNLGESALLQAIIKATNLCCPDGNFLGAVIPMCTPGTDCINSLKAYCYILALPRCMNKNYITGCYESCLECKDFCMIERRYCMLNPTTCCKQWIVTCDFKEDSLACTQSCNRIWDCTADYFKGISNVCCD